MGIPNTVDLSAAIRDIKDALPYADDEPSPFFFLVGAGISHPPIPLAFQIEEECRNRARRRHAGGEPPGGPPSDRPIDRYSHWFKAAHPHATQRAEYLDRLIRGTTEHDRPWISQANFRLAHLLLKPATVANLVVTTNFDDQLSRALEWFGETPIVCDHPGTEERIDPDGHEVQIVHVHGTYRYYDCVNLSDEIEDRAEAHSSAIPSMSRLLDRILFRHSPIVIGYGGWEGDVVMAALRRRLEGRRLPYNMYWFCYRPEDLPSAPGVAWLRDHPDVYFVLPTQSTMPAKTEGLGGLGRQQTDGRVQLGGSQSSSSGPPKLSAQQVLDRLIAEQDLQPPPLTTDPLAFLAERLKQALPRSESAPSGTGDGLDRYFIKSTIAKVEAAATQARAAAGPVEVVRDAIRRSQYEEAVKHALTVEVADLSDAESLELVEALGTAAEEIWENLDIQQAAYERILDLDDAIGDEPRARRWMATALNAADRHDEVLERYRDLDDPSIELRREIADAIWSQARWGSYDLEGSVIRFDEAIAYAGDEPALADKKAWSLLGKADALFEMQDYPDAQAVYEEVLTGFGADFEGNAQLGIGKSLLAQDRPAKAITAFDRAIDTHPHPWWVGEAQLGKAECLVTLGRPADALDLAREALDNLPPQEYAEHDHDRVLLVEARASRDMGRLEDARHAYDKLEERTRVQIADEFNEPLTRWHEAVAKEASELFGSEPE